MCTVRKRIALVLLLIVSQPGMAQKDVHGRSSLARQQTPAENPKLISKITQRYLADSDTLLRLSGDVEIPADSTLHADILHSSGTLSISGTVRGRVVSVNGHIDLQAGSAVSDDVISINGRILRRKGAHVSGEMVETVMPSLLGATAAVPPSPRRWQSKQEDSDTARTKLSEKSPLRVQRKRQYQVPKKRLQDFEQRENIAVHYNRVDGLFFGPRIMPAYNSRKKVVNIDLNGFFGYGFAAKKWQYRGNLEFWFFDNASLLTGVTLYDFSDTYDDWLIPEYENSFAAILTREDFQDYFRRQGAGVYLTARPGDLVKLTAGYYEDEFFSLAKNTDWSFFGGKKRFRGNPSILEGKARMIRSTFEFDNRDDAESPFRGWRVSAKAEWNIPAENDWFDYDRFVLDIRRYIPVGLKENFDFRLRVGTSRGAVPQQSLFYLGGISTLRGYDYKEFAGNRMVLANIEYRLNSEDRLRDVLLVEEFNLILFYDTGLAWFAEGDKLSDGFGSLSRSRLKSNIGVALSDPDGRVRLNLARRLDGRSKDLVVTFRINRAF